MRREKAPLWDKTDVKVFILALLDEMRHPMTYSAIIDAVVDCGCVQGFDFAECFSELREFGHVLEDTLGGETYFMISDTGSMVARELSSSLEPRLLEKARIIAAHHLALSSLGVVLHVKITETEDKRFRVEFKINNGDRGEMLSVAVSVSTRDAAEQIKSYCERSKPENIYRAVLSVVTGEIDYFL